MIMPPTACLLLLPLLSPSAGPDSVASRSPLEALAWLAGCWKGGGETVTEEQWMAPSGGVMLGMSRTLREGRAVAWEHLRLEEAENGTLRYAALPSGQEETAFTLTEAGPGKAVFENPAHDFPQRIIYTLVSPDSLIARIEGATGGRTRSVVFPFRRVGCP
ncbi:MAG: DUF6265 family protein [Bacteroidota bacterium]